MNLQLKIILSFFTFILFQDLIAINVNANINFTDELFIVLGIVFIVLKSREIRISTIIILSILMGILGIGIISGIYNHVEMSTTLKGGFLTVKGLLLFLIFKNLVFHEEDIKKIFKLFKILGIVVIFFACVDLFFYESFRGLLHTDNKLDMRSGIVSVQSIFIHPGTYGWFMVFIGLYFLAAYIIKKEKKNLMYMFISFCFAFLSFRFKVLLSITVILILVSFRKKFFAMGCIVAVTLFALFGGSAMQDLTNLTISRYISVDYTESARKALYHVGNEIAVNNFPLGEGFGRFGSWIARVDYSPVYYEYGLDRVYGLEPNNPMWATDTYWPSILGEIGIIGCLLFIVFFLFVITYIYGYFKKYSKQDDIKVFLLFAIFVIIQSLIESTGEQIFNNAPQYIYIFAVMGIAVSLIENRNVRRNSEK